MEKNGGAMGKTVLLVEDDPDHRAIVSAMLRHAGYEVQIAIDGEAGVEAALRLRPAAILMDASLPRLDGWTATARIKAHAPELCVVMLTANALPEHRTMAETVGCDRFLTKPISPQDVLQVVRECTGGEEAATPIE